MFQGIFFPEDVFIAVNNPAGPAPSIIRSKLFIIKQTLPSWSGKNIDKLILNRKLKKTPEDSRVYLRVREDSNL